MRSTNMNPYEDRLSRALDAEAERVDPAPDALATILSRVGDDAQPAAVVKLDVA